MGQYHRSFDGEGRLTLPSRFYELLADGAFVTQGFDRNLLGLTTAAFQDIYRRVMAMNIADPLARLLLRMILGNASEMQIDKSGRVLIPDRLRQFAGLESKAVLIGQGDYFEIWAPSLWDKQEAELQNADANAQRFAALNVATH